MPFIAAAQERLFLAERGSGSPALLCIHGAGGTHQHWGFQLQALHATMRVLAVDLPGHGRSARPGRSHVADYSRVVLSVLDALDLEQVVLVGHSMGGTVALWTALEAPERVAGLGLLATGARLPILPDLLHRFSDNPDAAVRLIVELAYADNAGVALRQAGELAFRQIDATVFQGDLQACDAFDVRGRLSALHCPTLVLCGEEDRVTPLKFSRYLHEQIAGSTLVVVPHAGHMVMLEQPQTVSEALGHLMSNVRLRFQGF